MNLNVKVQKPVPDVRAGWALFALAVGAFGIGTTEFSPMGMLPVIAEGVNVSIPSAGLLISAYAVGVMVGAPLMTIALLKLRRRTALMALMAIFTTGNVLSAVAPDYTTLLIARIITSLNHGAFFGIGAVVAASLVSSGKQAAAVATMFMGLTVANIGGVPAAAWIGQHAGWREAFAATALLGVAAMFAIRVALPAGTAGGTPDFRKELRVLTRPAVLLAMGTTVLGAGAMFTLYTYIVPALEVITDASAHFITLGLALIGVGFTVGNWLGGRLSSWSLDGATIIFLLALAGVMLLLPFMLRSTFWALAGLFLWGSAAFAIVPPVQTRVMLLASEAPGMASSVNVGAFNLGNALGAALGAAVLNAGGSYAAVPVAGSALAGLGCLLVLAGMKSQRRIPAAGIRPPAH